MVIVDLLQAGAGLILLIFCADYLVRGAVSLAHRLGLSTLIIGLTVVALGTSAPEFVTTLSAAFNGAPEMAVGNVVGSNMANLLLVLGAAAVAKPIICSPRAIKRDGMAMVAATGLFIAMGLANGLVAWQGTLLLLIFVGYLWGSYRAEQAMADNVAVHVQEAQEVTNLPLTLTAAIAMVVVSLIGITGGAQLLVTGGVGLARTFGVSEAVIGLTLIAIGTSLPELATVVMASLRGHGDVAVGNVIGSNIFNLLAVAGGVSVLHPLPVPDQIIHVDLWLLLAISLGVIAATMLHGRIPRLPGAVMLIAYTAYIALQFGPARQALGF